MHAPLRARTLLGLAATACWRDRARGAAFDAIEERALQRVLGQPNGAVAAPTPNPVALGRCAGLSEGRELPMRDLRISTGGFIRSLM